MTDMTTSPPDDQAVTPAATPADPPTDAAPAMPLLVVRSAIGGALMGLANLVPGISGGTMLLASGIYPRFIAAIAEVTRLRFRAASLVVLGVVVAAAAAAILTLAGVMGRFVVEHTWAAYSIFIGLTLGGVPVIWKLIGQPSKATWIGAAAGFAAMAALAYAQAAGVGTGGGDAGWGMMLLAGVAGAAAMILPGVSGGYLLLVLGVYVAILDGIDRFAQGLRAADMPAIMEVFMQVILPVGVGVVLGVVVVSNVLKVLLDRCTQATLGVLLGLLLGAVVGLWPFQQFVEPQPGSVLKNQQVVLIDGELRYEQTGRAVKPKDWPMAFFAPTGRQAGVAAGLVVGGFLCTAAIALLGRDRRGKNDNPQGAVP
jgi:putative membrane protein